MKRFKVYTIEKGLLEFDNYYDFSDLTAHREDGPAVISHENGVLIFEEYWFNGKLHRLNGPAYIGYDVNNNIIDLSYFINGDHYTKRNYDNELLKLKINLL